MDDFPNIPIYRAIENIKIVNGVPSNSLVRINSAEGSTLKLSRDEDGITTLDLSAAYDSPDFAHVNTIPEVILLLQKEEISLHISTLKTALDVSSYILNQITDDEQKQIFIDKVTSQLCWTTFQWERSDDGASAAEPLQKVDHREPSASWNILCATVKDHAAEILECLMRMVQDAEGSWKIITFQDDDKRMGLHVAISENMRTIVFLFGHNSAAQLVMADENVLKVSVNLIEPSLHMAALRNDVHSVFYMLRGSTEDCQKMVNEKNKDGYTVLHTASKANNPDVIKAIARALYADEFMSCASELTDDGETTLHLAAVSNSAAAAHAILSTHNRDCSKALLSARNVDGENAAEVAEKRSHKKTAEIIKCK